MFPPYLIPQNSEESRRLIPHFIDFVGHGVLLNSNGIAAPITGLNFDFIAGIGKVDELTAEVHGLDKLNRFIQQHRENKNWIFGYISYDVKNEIENIHSVNPDEIGFPVIHFFIPQFVLRSTNGISTIFSIHSDPAKAWNDFLIQLNSNEVQPEIKFSHVPNRDNYIYSVKKILDLIHNGDIYELNFCQQLLATAQNFQPATTFISLTEFAPGPFSCYVNTNNKFLISASPERFIMKMENRIFSQPIKGTARRDSNEVNDIKIKKQLGESEKERAENIMIVDLVRNDLSKVAEKGSVKVDELCGVYSFPRVHQMISTVSCDLKSGTNFSAIIRALFPMGSMTGAPKVSAMNIIDEMEDFKRGLFSGTVGYIDPEGNFDFNVVIRCILYNAVSNLLAIPAGGAITSKSIPADEFEEMLLKLKPQLQVLGFDVDELVISKTLKTDA